MSATESVAKAVTVITEVLDESQKRWRQEDAIEDILGEAGYEDISSSLGVDSADNLRDIVRNSIAKKAGKISGNHSDDLGDGLK